VWHSLELDLLLRYAELAKCFVIDDNNINEIVEKLDMAVGQSI